MPETYGVKVSQDGFDVRTCADYQLLYSSAWPLLKIGYQGSVTIVDASLDQVILTHTLGYVPMFWVFSTNNGGIAPWETNASSKLLFPGYAQFAAMDANTLTWKGSLGFPAVTLTLYYYVFLQDMEDDFTAEIVNSLGESPEDGQEYGIKVSKPGFDVEDTDFRNFVVRSDCRSPQIHSITTGSFPFGGGTQVINHNLGYEPMYFVYARLAAYGGTYYQMVATADDAVVTASTTQVTVGISFECDYSIVIYKDPILLN